MDTQQANPQKNNMIDVRIKIVPRSVKGHFRNIKTLILIIAYGTYFLLPWMSWERDYGPDQSILFDIIERKFYIFGLVMFAQDIFWLAGFLIIAAILLFFVTGLFGRVFCGYFCFQTMWTDVFMYIERLVQGDRNKRLKFIKAPLSVNKIAKKLLTWFLWLLVSFLTGITFTLYWGEADVLIVSFFTGDAPFPAYATTLFLMLTTFVMAGVAREQVCTYMCPYARFQSSMFDQNTLVVSYDEKRGERENGRCKPAKGIMENQSRIDKGVGDCIDCGYCVQVCPVGIDIREGIQYQCITCALCIDACDTIMKAISYPSGLIRYTSEAEQKGNKTKFISLKNIAYSLVLLVSISILSMSIISRSKVEIKASQQRQPVYVLMSDGGIQNRYQLKINNKETRAITYRISVVGFDKSEWIIKPSDVIHMEAAESIKLDVIIRARQDTTNNREFLFVVESIGEEPVLHAKTTSQFNSPEK